MTGRLPNLSTAVSYSTFNQKPAPLFSPESICQLLTLKCGKRCKMVVNSTSLHLHPWTKMCKKDQHFWLTVQAKLVHFTAPRHNVKWTIDHQFTIMPVRCRMHVWNGSLNPKSCWVTGARRPWSRSSSLPRITLSGIKPTILGLWCNPHYRLIASPLHFICKRTLFGKWSMSIELKFLHSLKSNVFYQNFWVTFSYYLFIIWKRWHASSGLEVRFLAWPFTLLKVRWQTLVHKG